MVDYERRADTVNVFFFDKIVLHKRSSVGLGKKRNALELIVNTADLDTAGIEL